MSGETTLLRAKITPEEAAEFADKYEVLARDFYDKAVGTIGSTVHEIFAHEARSCADAARRFREMASRGTE